MKNHLSQNTKILFIEAQRLFRVQKHGMDVVAEEILRRLKEIPTQFEKCLLVKVSGVPTLEESSHLKIKILNKAFYPFWEQWILPRFTTLHKNSLLHCTGNTAPLWSSTPILITIHDLIFLEKKFLFKKDEGSLYQRFGNIYRRFVVPRVAKKAKHIITVSEFQRQLIIKKLAIPKDKISVVYNGVDERFFILLDSITKQHILETYGIGSLPFIFFFANTDPRKNSDGVIKAFVQFCESNPQYNHTLVIKGFTERQLTRKLKQFGAAAYKDRFKRIGYITSEHLPAFYQSAAMLWFPSFSEGFGLPIIEAMAGGTPVITSKLSVMPEIAGDAALYVNPYKTDQLVLETIKLLTNNTLRLTLTENGKIRAKQFTWEKSVDGLMKIYEKMMTEL